MMRGVMKKISSAVLVSTCFALNRAPRYGMLPMTGIWLTVTVLVVAITPPMTMVLPSVTRTEVVSAAVLMAKFAPDAWPTVESSTSTVRKMVPSAVICGVTVRRRKTGTYVVEAGADNVAGVTTGICVPCLTVAGLLFCVTTRGRERTFAKLLLSDAFRMVSKL